MIPARRTRSTLVLSLGLSLTLSFTATVGAQPQTQTFHKPMAPIGPTSEDQCRALEADWSMVCKRISDAHEQCLAGYNGTDVKGAGQCSRAPCLSLHQQMTTCGGAERRQAVDACYGQVREVKAREAEFRRMQEEAIRAQQRAELEHRQRLEADAGKSMAEANEARRRAEAYRRSSPSPASRHSALDDRQAGMVEALRRQAETIASNVHSTVARAGTAWNEVDASRITDSGRDLLRHEGLEILMEGLSRSEHYAWIPETIEMSTDFLDIGTALMNGASYMRDRLAGETTDARNWNALLDGIEFTSEYGPRIPLLRLPAIGQVGGVVSGLRDTHSYLSAQLDAITNAFIENRPYELPETFNQEVIRRLLGGVLPTDRFERIKRFGNDASYTWDSTKNAIYRLLNP